MKTIIAATDFSTASMNAANYAADLAVAVEANLVLVNVVQTPVTISEVPMPEPVFEEMLHFANEELKGLASELTKRTRGKIDISTQTMIGTVEYQISELSNEKKPFAIVMGLSDSKAAERFLSGSETIFAIKHLPYPVLVIPKNVVFKGIHKIGLACDLNNVADTFPFDSLKKILSAFNASLDIIRVSKQEKYANSKDLDESVSIQKKLSPFHPIFHFLKHEKIEEGIHEFSKQHQLDLLIIFPKHHNLLDLFNEKHSKKIILHQEIPVMSLHC